MAYPQSPSCSDGPHTAGVSNPQPPTAQSLTASPQFAQPAVASAGAAPQSPSAPTPTLPPTPMPTRDYVKLLADLEAKLATGATSIAILGLTDVTLRLVDFLARTTYPATLSGIYVAAASTQDASSSLPVHPMAALAETHPDLILVAEDDYKQELLEHARPFIRGLPSVLIAGYGHYRFRDSIFDSEVSRLAVPSLANGYPHILTHIYQCLANASRLALIGVVAEFGMFRGGTTMLISRFVEHLGQDWPVIGFDTFAGFPPRRSALDMYDHPDCVFTDISAVQRYLADRNVEIVAGDIVDTVHRLENEELVLSFFDTDNFTPASAALDVVQDRTVVGGAIVFDHFMGTNRFRYTLGERMAASRLLHDRRYFHLHGTGVFLRQR